MASHLPNFFSFPYCIIIIIIFTTDQNTTAKASCAPKTCSPTGLTVRFPFRLSDDRDLIQRSRARCGYPGFELSCRNNYGDAILSLPSGDFAVKTIIYEAQTLTIDDPGQCLPKRFLESNFSVSGTPFRARNLGSFTFLNCSSAPKKSR
ncbi:Wall-associated receptor kinase, galacturonan-binding domain containing protein [Trema orientale]|uniref:RING-type E3 ubiquitin transferase n=1 Tax=Trema orientale TaxID=63057 RepID=A0A2P5D6Y0_TREOI|nr:Wall-associated receptor kinase, galacturonan-binding domain containing protein [Trema orientale]